MLECYGTSEHLSIKDVPTPDVGPGQVAIDRCFPIAEYLAAFVHQESGKARGKFVLDLRGLQERPT